jgi:hypothetical protein
VLVVEVAQLERTALRQWVLLWHRQHERFIEQRFDLQLVVMDRQRQHAGIEATVAQSRQDLVGLFLDQQQFQPRKALAHGGQHMREQVGRQRREDAQPHRAGFRILAATRDLAHLLDFGDDLARALGDLATDRGQHHPAWRAFDQGDAELVFQLADLRGQRRLADEAGRGGTAEVLVVGKRDEVAEITEVHGDLNSLWLSPS